VRFLSSGGDQSVQVLGSVTLPHCNCQQPSLHYARVGPSLKRRNENLMHAAFRGNPSFTGSSGCVINDQQLFATLDTRATLMARPLRSSDADHQFDAMEIQRQGLFAREID